MDTNFLILYENMINLVEYMINSVDIENYCSYEINNHILNVINQVYIRNWRETKREK